jgi:hypothetical protein
MLAPEWARNQIVRSGVGSELNEALIYFGETPPSLNLAYPPPTELGHVRGGIGT